MGEVLVAGGMALWKPVVVDVLRCELGVGRGVRSTEAARPPFLCSFVIALCLSGPVTGEDTDLVLGSVDAGCAAEDGELQLKAAGASAVTG